MDLTVDQALSKGIAEHNAGNIQEAERVYRAILNTQPGHPQTNHNLGLIVSSIQETGAAIPFFKIAVDGNPSAEQFWISYVDELIKDKQFKDAKRAIKKAKKSGLMGHKLDILQKRLNSAIKLKVRQPNHVSSPANSDTKSLYDFYQAGNYDDAERLALQLTKNFPRDHFSWKVLSGVFRNTGRLDKALIASQTAVGIDSKDAESHHNLGNVLLTLGHLEEAASSIKYGILLSKGKESAQSHFELGGILQELGRSEDAEASYRDAIALNPKFAEAQNNLGMALDDLGRLDEAESSYRQAIALRAGYSEAYNNLATTLEALGRPEEAKLNYERAIVLKPGFTKAHYNLGLLFYALNQYESAMQQFTLADSDEARSYSLRCLYNLDEKVLFFNLLDDSISQGNVDPIIGSLACRSFLRYGVKRQNLFCGDPLKYVLETNLNNRYDFHEIFVRKVRAVLSENKLSKKRQGLLTNGYQTYGNLFDIEQGLTENIQEVIHLELEKYRANFCNSDEGLIKHWPEKYSLNAWIVSMKSGGELRPHMHEKGWISGSIYISVPPKKESESGNLVVCIEDDAAGPNEMKSIDVVTGSLCLFPASLLHYTIPFESDEDRIVLAFDVVPI